MKIGERISNLINVKSIITLALTAVFCALSLNQAISPEQFVSIFTIIIGFYFGVQKEKKDSKKETTDLKDSEYNEDEENTKKRNYKLKQKSK